MAARLGLMLALGVAALPGCGQLLRPSPIQSKNFEEGPLRKVLPGVTPNSPTGETAKAEANPGDSIVPLQPRYLPEPKALRPVEEQEPTEPPLPKVAAPPSLPEAPPQESHHESKLASMSQPVLELPAAGQEKREPVVDALQCVIDNRHNEALRHLQKYDQPTQELFLRLLPAMALLTQKGIDQLSSTELGVLHEQLHGLLCAIRPRTDLAISKACFCEWVKAYGVFKPLAEGHGFVAPNNTRPGELVQLYVELRNFSHELQAGFYTTKLSSSVEIHDQKDPNGKPIWFYRFEDHKHPLRSRTMLQDYFNNYSFYVPALPPGNYVLTVHIADETRPNQRRVARKSLEFRVTSIAPPSS